MKSGRYCVIGASLLLVGLDATPARSAGKEPEPDRAAALRKSDPCRLLTPKEVEGVLGPLAGPPYRAAGTTADPKGVDCRYQTAEGRSIRVNVTWEGGAQFIGMMGAMGDMVNKAGLGELKLSERSAVTGEWDKAHVSQCCEFNALRGDRLVTVDVSGSHATIEQAAALAATAVKRLDQPLDLDGADGIKAARERATQQPKRRSVCELLPQADAEAITGVPLLAAPRGDDEACTYAWPMNGSPYSVKLMVQWTDGFSAFRSVSSMTGQASSMLGLGKVADAASVGQADAPWDEFSQSIIGVMAVRRDVLASVESGPFRQDMSKAFVAKALANLSR